MSIYLLNATRKINQRVSATPMTRKQLFNMLLDFGAFKGSSILKYAVKNIIFEGFWNQLANAYNNYYYDYMKHTEVDIVKYRIKTTFGYSDEIINVISTSIADLEDWDIQWNPSDLTKSLHFEGIPICGTTFDFVNALLSKGYSYDPIFNTLNGTYENVKDCTINFNMSCHDIPIFMVDVHFPKNTDEKLVHNLRTRILLNELSRRPELKNDPYFLERGIYTKKIDNQLIIRFIDPWGNGMYIESECYSPSYNNLSTID